MQVTQNRQAHHSGNITSIQSIQAKNACQKRRLMTQTRLFNTLMNTVLVSVLGSLVQCRIHILDPFDVLTLAFQVLRSIGLAHMVPIRENEARDVPIRAIGVWDTVGEYNFHRQRVLDDANLVRCFGHPSQSMVSEALRTAVVSARVQVARHQTFGQCRECVPSFGT